MEPWRSCPSSLARLHGVVGGAKWGADGGGWHTSDLHLQRITHRHLTRRTSTSSAIRAIERLGCAGGALEVRASVNAGVLKDQRHRRLSSALSSPGARLRGLSMRNARPAAQGRREGQRASAPRTCTLSQCAWQLRDRLDSSLESNPVRAPSGSRSPGNTTKTGRRPHVQQACTEPARIKAS